MVTRLQSSKRSSKALLGGLGAVLALSLVTGCKDPAPPTPTKEVGATAAPEANGKPAEANEGAKTPKAENPQANQEEKAAAATNDKEGDKAKEGALAGKPGTKTPGTPEPAVPEAPASAAAVASTAPAVPEPPPPEPVLSPKIAEKGFSVWMQTSGRYKAGQQGFVDVVLVPKGEFHCNQEYPYKMKLGAAPAGVTYPTAIVRTEGLSVSPARATMRVPFVAANAGDATIAGKFYFSVCTSEQCVIDNRDVAVTVKVE